MRKKELNEFWLQLCNRYFGQPVKHRVTQQLRIRVPIYTW